MTESAKIIELFEDRKLKCCKCGEDKPVFEFYKSNAKKRGFIYKCKSCVSMGRRRGYVYPEDRKIKIGEITAKRHLIAREARLKRMNETQKLFCNKCKDEKPFSEFQRDGGRWSGHRASCIKCCSSKTNYSMREWYAKNKDKVWWSRRKSTHGITKEQYLHMLAVQNGVCAICKKKPIHFLRIDHNHKTKKVRGLLCECCNSGIGFLRDSVTVLRNAAVYLEERGSYGEA